MTSLSFNNAETIFEWQLQIFKNGPFLELTQEFRCGFEQGFLCCKHFAVVKVLVIGCSIPLKRTHIEINFKPPPYKVHCQ